MKKTLFVAALLAAVTLVSGCGAKDTDEAENITTQTTSAEEVTGDAAQTTAADGEAVADGSTTTTVEAQTADVNASAQKFKPGTWYTQAGYNYVFYADGSSGKIVDPLNGTAVPFSYEATSTGYVFHKGGDSDNSPAKVTFSEDGESASITWVNDTTTVLTFTSDDTDTSGYSDTAVATGQAFRSGTWNTQAGYNYVFNTDGSTGKIEDPMNGTSIAFKYTFANDVFTLKMNGMDTSSTANVTFSSDNLMATVEWDDGTTSVLTYADPVEEPDATMLFKTGTWAADSNRNYVFYADGSGGKVANLETGLGVPFEYEIEGNMYIFHFGSVEDNSPASIVFRNDGETAVITWDDGEVTTLTFQTEDTSDEVAYGGSDAGTQDMAEAAENNGGYDAGYDASAGYDGGYDNSYDTGYEDNSYGYDYSYDYDYGYGY